MNTVYTSNLIKVSVICFNVRSTVKQRRHSLPPAPDPLLPLHCTHAFSNPSYLHTLGQNPSPPHRTHVKLAPWKTNNVCIKTAKHALFAFLARLQKPPNVWYSKRFPLNRTETKLPHMPRARARSPNARTAYAHDFLLIC